MNDYRDCHILHADMDAFYASVEVADDPSLRGLPVIVGHTGGRGVVLSATYEARALGVRSAIPVAAAQRSAPRAIVVPPRHERYAEVSARIMKIFRDFTAKVEPLSLDEAFLDVAGAYRLFGGPVEIARAIRTTIVQETGITCSVGISVSKLVAKLASDMCKPDGLLVVPAGGVVDFMHPLPVRKLWGVGPTTAQTLEKLGIRTIGELAHTPAPTLAHALGERQGMHLHDLAWGRDNREVVVDEPEKSVGSETTFDRDLSDFDEVRAHLLRQSNSVARRLRHAGMSARTISIKVRFEDFTTITRSRTLNDPTDVSHRIYDVAQQLFDSLNVQRVRIRLVGVRATGLVEGGRSAGLFEDADDHWGAVERVTDEVAVKFGSNAVTPARLVLSDATDESGSSEDEQV